jgi:hypothetical protein
MVPKSLSLTMLVAGAVTFTVATAVVADEAMPDSSGGRYSFSKQDDGFLRLDSQTGQVSLCSRKAVGFACEAAPEDRALLENEITRLRSENAALKKDLLSRGLPLPPGVMPEPDNGNQNGVSNLRLPSDAEIDRAFSFAGRVWRRFIDAVDRAQKQILNKS